MLEAELKKISDNIYEISKIGQMLVPGRIYADEEITQDLKNDLNKEWNAIRQIINVASLPGIEKYSLALADVHPGYGFCIGGIGAFNLDQGVISVAGVGFDINCGVRVMKTKLTQSDIEPQKENLAQALFENIPAGLGMGGKIKMDFKQIEEILINGAKYIVKLGYGLPKDLEYIEEGGKINNANPEKISEKAKRRQIEQIGTLGSGNHYLEIDIVDKIIDQEAAKVFGLFESQAVISIHCGSRGLGHQIGSDYLKILEAASKKYKIPIRERELVAAPIKSPEGQDYLQAVNCGTNAAFANRQVIAHLARKTIGRVMKIKETDIDTMYEVGHNTCKIEKHRINGIIKDVLVHRKGSTRAFGPGRIEICKKYRKIGQPLFVGGTMGTASYILKGTAKAMNETFGSGVHGAGRRLSRSQAKKIWRGEELRDKLKQEGIIIKGHSMAGLAEEAPGAYKDIESVVNVMHNAGINEKVARLKPYIVIKG